MSDGDRCLGETYSEVRWWRGCYLIQDAQSNPAGGTEERKRASPGSQGKGAQVQRHWGRNMSDMLGGLWW